MRSRRGPRQRSGRQADRGLDAWRLTVLRRKPRRRANASAEGPRRTLVGITARRGRPLWLRSADSRARYLGYDPMAPRLSRSSDTSDSERYRRSADAYTSGLAMHRNLDRKRPLTMGGGSGGRRVIDGNSPRPY